MCVCVKSETCEQCMGICIYLNVMGEMSVCEM